MMNTVKTNKTYATQITKQADGTFRVFFLYNITNPTHSYSNGDIHDMKVYKTEKTATSKAAKWLAAQ